ncbi:tetratricopeptide repeat protein [Legionella worsleiensis]
MNRSLIVMALVFTASQAHAFDWTDLWYTPDQKAQHLMDRGQFKKAKETFARNDWIASAAYRSGDYERAAELFKELNNEQGYYNQGNALAHMGQYEQAVEAYNKALSLNPDNQDALHNRKLIEELLKKDKEQKQNKDQQNKDQQNKDQQNKDQQNKDQQNKDQQNKDQQNKDQQNKDQQNKDQQNKDQQNKDQQNKDQQSKEQQKNKQNKGKDNQLQENDAQSEAEQEKQQAKQQWLRLIPDDPGGLMREKFLRDHLRRARGWYQ